MDNAISCQVVGGCSGSGSSVVEAPGSPESPVPPSFVLMGITFVFVLQMTAVDGEGKGVSVPLGSAWAR